MPKKTLITWFIVVLVAGVILGVFAFSTQQGKSPAEVGKDVFVRFSQKDTAVVDTTDQSGQAESATSDLNEDVVLPALRQLSARAVAGAFIFEEGGETVTRFVERETGHVFEIGKDRVSATRITNTTIPRVQRALWIDENSLILQYLDEASASIIESFSATISDTPNTDDQSGIEKSLIGSFLPQNLRSLTSSGDGRSIFYFLNDGVVGGFISNTDGSNERRVLDLPITEWLAEWPSGGIISLTTKASGLAAGQLYFLNTVTKNFQGVLDSILGLTTNVSPDRTQVLYTESTGRGFLFGVADVASGKRRELALQTLAEKCVWSELSSNIVYCGVPSGIPPAIYPDSWYQGQIAFSDNLWMINVEDGTAEILARPLEEARQAIDVIEPHLSPAEDFLIFTNKEDGALWGFILISS